MPARSGTWTSDERHHPAPSVRHRRRGPRRRRTRRDHRHRDPGGDGELLPRLRDVGHHQPRPARRARRAQAGASSDPLVDVRPGFPARPGPCEVRPGHRRRDGPLPPPRRQRDLRRTGAHGPTLLAAPPVDRLPRELRLTGGSARRGALHRVQAPSPRDADARRHRREHRRLHRQLLRRLHRTGRAAGPFPQPAGQRQPGHRGGHGHQHPAPQPQRGLRRGHPPAAPPRCVGRRSDGVRQGSRFPDRGADPRPRRHRVGLSHGSGFGEDAGRHRAAGTGTTPGHRGHRPALPGLGRRRGPQDLRARQRP